MDIKTLIEQYKIVFDSMEDETGVNEVETDEIDENLMDKKPNIDQAIFDEIKETQPLAGQVNDTIATKLLKQFESLNEISLQENLDAFLKNKIADWYKNAEIDYGITGKMLKTSLHDDKLTIEWEEKEPDKDKKHFKMVIPYAGDYTDEQLYNIWMEQSYDVEEIKDIKEVKDIKEDIEDYEDEDEYLDSFEYIYSQRLNGNISEYKEKLAELQHDGRLGQYVDYCEENGLDPRLDLLDNREGRPAEDVDMEDIYSSLLNGNISQYREQLKRLQKNGQLRQYIAYCQELDLDPKIGKYLSESIVATLNNKLNKIKFKEDEDAAEELQLFIVNDGDMYRNICEPAQEKEAKGEKVDWLKIAVEGARKYRKEISSKQPDAPQHFSAEELKEVADYLKEYYTADLKKNEDLNSDTEIEQLKAEIREEIKKYFTEGSDIEEEELGDLMEYVYIDDRIQDERVVVEVRAELGYESMIKLAERLDKIVQKYDKDAYFDQVEPGIMEAFLKVNLDESLTDKVVAKFDEGKHEIVKCHKGYFNRYNIKDGIARTTTKCVESLPTALGALKKRYPKAQEDK